MWALHIPLFLIHSITSTHKAHTLFYHGANIAETANTHTAHIMKMYTRFIRVSYVRTDALVLENHITGISCNNVRNACRVFSLFFFSHEPFVYCYLPALPIVEAQLPISIHFSKEFDSVNSIDRLLCNETYV